MESRLQAVLLLTLIAAKAFSDAAPAERPPYSQAYHYARLLTHVVKNMAAWASIDITRYSMELMGGVGFLEEYPMAKLHRDALVTAIWEGTSNIQSLDMAEVFYKKEAGKILFEDLAARISRLRDDEVRHKLVAALEEVREEAAAALRDGVELHAKRLLTQIGTLAAAALYREWAVSTQEEWADAMSKIYVNVELLKRDVESALVRKLWTSLDVGLKPP
jgi:acyl-CoA dehydrogenase